MEQFEEKTEWKLYSALFVLQKGWEKNLEEGLYSIFCLSQKILRVQENGEDLLRVAYDYKFHRLSIYFFADHFSGKICGMCGNYDGRDSNDQNSVSVCNSATLPRLWVANFYTKWD